MNTRQVRHLGGPDDTHYARLGTFQPLEIIEAWSQNWPTSTIYHLGEALMALARCGTKGQPLRDLRKASFLLSRAADIIEGESVPRQP